MNSDISEVDSFKTWEGWWGWETVGNLKLDVTWSLVFNYFLLGTIKVATGLLVFLASLTDLLFFLASHHRLMTDHEGRDGWRGSVEKWQPELGCQPTEDLQKAQRAVWFWLAFLTRKHGRGQEYYVCSAAGTYITKNWFLQHLTTVTCTSL